MPDDREYYYACFMPAYEFVAASSVADAIAIIRHASAGALGHDVAVGVAGESLPVWADAGTNLRYELGEREDEVSRWRRAEDAAAAGRGVPQMSSGRPSAGAPCERTVRLSDGPRAPTHHPPKGGQGPAQLQRCVSPEQFGPWAQLASVCATGARSEPVRNALGESVRRTLEHRTTAGGTWQFVVKMTQR